MRTSDFDYQLPDELIAQTPIEPRDHSRLLVLDRQRENIEHGAFHDIADYLHPGDLLVCNESRVIPARLSARRADTGGKLEILLLKELEEGVWETLVKPGKRARPGTRLVLGSRVEGIGFRGLSSTLYPQPSTLDPIPSTLIAAEVLDRTDAGGRVIRFSDPAGLESLGATPLPPYIKTPLRCPDRYQTIYARPKGSVAAPTAGLHFTPDLMARLRRIDVDFGFVTLHVGLDTFRPVEEDEAEDHAMHSEYCEVGPEVADKVNRAKAENRRVIAVGTTTVRALESAARGQGSWVGGQGTGDRDQGTGIRGGGTDPRPPIPVPPYAGWTRLFILPGFEFKIVDALITNFHLPRSTLLMLVSAFAGREAVLGAYEEAIRQEYRFYSFGDAMLIF